jgi:hypothetical protein
MLDDAARTLNEDPVGGSEILGYVVRLLVDGRLPDRVGPAVMKAWSDELSAILHPAPAPSPDDSTASS